MPQCVGFAPIIASDTRVLVLGSMPGVASLNAQAYYAHPRNGLWPIVANYADSTGTAVSIATEPDFVSRYRQLLSLRIGLWDVLAQAIRPGSLDANIRKDSLVVNAFNQFFDDYPAIAHIALNGQAASQWFQRLVWPTLSAHQQQRLSWYTLPSTSPAHASLSLAQKSAQWLPVLAHASAA